MKVHSALAMALIFGLSACDSSKNPSPSNSRNTVPEMSDASKNKDVLEGQSGPSANRPQLSPSSQTESVALTPTPARFDVSILGHKNVFHTDGTHPLFHVTYSGGANYFGISFKINPLALPSPEFEKKVVLTRNAYNLKWALIDLSTGKEVIGWKMAREFKPGGFQDNQAQFARNNESKYYRSSGGYNFETSDAEDIYTFETFQASEASYAASHISNLALALRYKLRQIPFVDDTRLYFSLSDYCGKNPENFFDMATGRVGCQDPKAPLESTLSHDQLFITDVIRHANGAIELLDRDEGEQACEKRGMHLPSLREILVAANAHGCRGYVSEERNFNISDAYTGEVDSLCAYNSFSSPMGLGAYVSTNTIPLDIGVWTSSNMRSVRNDYYTPGAFVFIGRGDAQVYIPENTDPLPGLKIKRQVRCVQRAPYGWKYSTNKTDCEQFDCKAIEL